MMVRLKPANGGNARRVSVFLLLLLLVTVPAFSAWVAVSSQMEGTAPEWRVLSCTPSSTVIEFTMNGYWGEDVREDGLQFTRLVIPGDLGTTQRVGWPELPTESKMVGLPPTGSVSVRVVDVDYVTYPAQMIYPFQTPLMDDQDQVGFDRDEDAYRASSLYPETWVEIEDPTIWRDVRISRMTFHPFRVNSAEGELQVVRHLVVEVETGGPGGINPMTQGPHPVRPHFYKMYDAAVVNFNELGYTTLQTDEDPGTQFLVITNPECLSAIEPLTTYRHEQGYKVEIRTLEPTFDEAQEFKAYITSLYLSTGLEYVLIVGDAYYGGGAAGVDVPMYWWQPESPGSYSDSWYSCVVPGDDWDHEAELAIGRIVYDDTLELADQIGKTMDYILDGDTTSNWFHNTLLVAHREQYPLKYTQCKNQIAAYPFYVEPMQFDSVYGQWGNNQMVINYINTSGCGILNYRGHGSDVEWYAWCGTGFGLGEIAQLTNVDRYFVHFDVCCDNMNIIDHYGNCFCEELMKHTGGCIAVIGAIIPSYTIPNHDFDKELYKGCLEEGITNIGYTSNYANITVLAGHGSIGRSNVRTYLWLGDAAIDVYTDMPAPLLVDYPVGTNVGIPDIDFTVETAAGAVEGAMVCVSNDEVYSRGFTDAQGEVTITMNPAPQIGGQLQLWVTAHNCRPFHAEIEIIQGYGDLVGTVTDAATSTGIEGAVITVLGPEMTDTTDANGDYEILEIPAWTYDVTVEAEGYLPEMVSVTIDSGEVIEQDFDLLHPECAVDVTEIAEYLSSNEEVQVDVTIANAGNGPLDYEIECDFNPLGLPNPPTDFSETLWDTSVTEILSAGSVNDPFLNGVEFAWDEYWVTGSGGGTSYRFYRFDSDWNYLGYYMQPVTQSLGARDMAFDGEYLWTGDRDSIVCINSSGEEVRRIPGPYNPNRALAFNDHTGNLYVVDRTNDVLEIDPEDGAVIQTFDNGLDIMGLAFMPDYGDDGCLYLFIGGSATDSMCVYMMDVASGDQNYVGTLNAPLTQRAGGCTITNGLDRRRWTFLGLTAGTDDYVEAYNLGFRTGWLSVEPDSGTVAAGSQTQLVVTLASGDYQDGDYVADIIIQHNATGGEDIIDVTMYVNMGYVADATGNVPTEFRLDQAYPNPFNPTTTIPFALSEPVYTRLAVFNILGQKVATLVDGQMEAGEYRVTFDGRNLASGLYFYQLEAGNFLQTRKVVMLK